MKKYLPEEDFRKAESTLNTKDGGTNDSGALMTALAAAKVDKERGSNQVRAILQSLDSKTLARVQADFEKDYGVPLKDSLAHAKLTKSTEESLKYLTKGIDKITSDDILQMSKIALSNGDKRAFAEAIRGNSQQAKDARASLLNDPGIHEKLQDAFNNPDGMGLDGQPPADKDWQKAVDPIINDYLKDGGISLKAVIENDHPGWPFDNVGNTGLAARNATETERNQYIAGKELSNSKHDILTNDQKAALEYYNTVHDAFARVGTKREASMLEDQLIHGRETIVSQMAATHSDGYTFLGIASGHNKDELLSRAEHLSKEDWQLLTTQKQGNETNAEAAKRSSEFRSQIEISLDLYASADKEQIMKLLDQKAGAESFEKAQLPEPDAIQNFLKQKQITQTLSFKLDWPKKSCLIPCSARD